ncbi:ImmA/IrrE family metallo-endopeptidase [Priestia megaterium]|uniref:ImmA/IrrE family metallo-endopeptidase n=1 Tax=Priestia megaterium TaxID=1404 RepID=UPI0012B9D9F0|nr:ImmA/IrrE family metallo-endopeptidase [Priestia megaterium]
MSVRVQVKREILEWAYNRSMKKEKLHHKFKKLDDWLKGNIQPTLKQLEDFAKSTSTPLGYFFLQQPPVEELPIPHYRKIDDEFKSNASPDLIETLHMMQRRQDFMKEYYDEYIGEPLEYVGSYTGSSFEELASNIRSLLNLDFEWASKINQFDKALNYLISRCEKNRIVVMINGIVGNNTHRKLDVGEFRGFVLVDNTAPLIFLNGADAKSAQIFTLIHEVAHILIGSSAVVEASPLNEVEEGVEQLCNSAAAEFLCPKDIFIEKWNTHYADPGVYKTIGKIFKVSPIVIARRALDLKRITKTEFYSFYTDYKRELENIVSSPASSGHFHNTLRVRLGNLFSSALIYQTKSGNIPYTDAYRLTGLKGSTFENYIKFYEGRGM